MNFTFEALGIDTIGALVVFAGEKLSLSNSAKMVDDATNGALSKAAKTAKFKGKRGSMLMMLAPVGIDASRVLLVGTGDMQKITTLALNNLGAGIIAKLQTSGETTLHIAFDDMQSADVPSGEAAARIAEGALLRNYRFDKYRTKEPKSKKPTVAAITVATSAAKEAEKHFAVFNAVAEGVFLTRDLVSEPANILYPKSFAERIQALSVDGVEVEVLGEAEMTKLGMGSLLSVGQGSERESQLAIMRWNGGKKGDQPIAFVGKGVTFDTGGISIKPASGMEQMKWDMGGAGTVVGLMKALAGRKAKVNVVAIVGLVENMPSGNASRPGDVVTSMSGQTIEVINTDAEGRLVLADALWYCQDRYAPKFMIDLATLTGAIIVTLGNEHAGIFTDDDAIASRLSASGDEVGDKVWRLPLHDDYDKRINCDIADMSNMGSPAGAGSITAAQFLKRFTNDTPWCHMDVAGTVWSNKNLPLSEKGGTGFGVRLLNHFVEENYEG